MNSFLKIVAGDLLKKYGNNLSKITIVFPNKRASLFLNEELIQQSDGKPVWSPRYLTISDLFRSVSPLIIADQIKLVCELYKHYVAITKSTESLDEFYGWGEMMLADFDDLDKNMGNPKLIFENTSELHEYDSMTFLTMEQKEALKNFFSNFNEDNESHLKKNFLQLWNNLGSIYDSFREGLRNQSIAYEGMLYRDVIENNLLVNNEDTTYAFVGFNLLQKVEQNLFETLAREGKAVFYWDYDKFYMKADNEAGRFIREMMRCFPNEITEEKHPDVFNNMENKEITYISASSEDIQARYVTQWLTQERIDAGKRTAIVLCDEKLLPTVIHCLPDNVKNVNITTGYPLSQTLVVTLLKQVFELKLMGKSRKGANLRLHHVNNVLRHPYMKYLSSAAEEVMTRINKELIYYPTLDDVAKDETLRMLFTPLTPEQQKDNKSRNIAILTLLLSIIKIIAKNSEAMRNEIAYENTDAKENKNEPNNAEIQLMQESLYRIHQIVTRILSMVESGELDVDVITIQGLLNQIIRSTNVPFHGEPIIGVQIMGVLETRNLDFDNILILSANEGNMPKGVNDSSFITHTIRRSYALTTIENKVAIYAYYFHRMIQRAGSVTFTYNNTSSDIRTCEMSRFMMQLLAESKMNISMANMTSELTVIGNERKEITKNKSVIKRMEEIGKVSPSAINDFLNCQLIYFYKHVCGISDNEKSDIEQMDTRTFGLIFHTAAQFIYNPYIGKTVYADNIEAMLKDENFLEDIINRAFQEQLFKIDTKKNPSRKMPPLDGTQIINHRIITRLLKDLLVYDKKQCPFKIIGLECKVNDYINVETTKGRLKLLVKGFIDRLDEITEKDGKRIIRVVDYKTGGMEASVDSIENVFSAESKYRKKHNDYYLQTLLYCKILASPEEYCEKNPAVGTTPVVPALLYPHKSYKDDYNPILKIGSSVINDYREFNEEYKNKLNSLISEIYDYTKPFTPTEDTSKCASCHFAAICGKMT